MIQEYYRPETLKEALALLSRETPKTVPLGGGTVLNTPGKQPPAVVDLQALGWGGIEKKGREVSIGATATLQQLLETEGVQTALTDAIRLEAALNMRQMGTVAGAVVTSGGRSPFLTTMLALDANLVWQPGDVTVPLGEFLPLRDGVWPGKVISEVRFSVKTSLAYAYSARSAADKPIVCAAAARWPSGRTRIVLGGFGKAPLLVMDGEANEGLLEAAEAAYLTAGDQWASAEYRSETAGVLVERCLNELGE